MFGLDDIYLYILIILILIIVIIGIIGWVIVQIKTSKTQISLAAAEVDKKKLELIMKRAMIEDLKNASVMLSDKERAKLDSIRTDTAILSRRVLFSMNEVEDRTQRLERGADLGKLNMTLGDIKRYERKLFGDGIRSQRKKVVPR